MPCYVALFSRRYCMDFTYHGGVEDIKILYFFLAGALESLPASATAAESDQSNRVIRLNVVNLN